MNTAPDPVNPLKRHTDKREAILAAALELFSARTFDGTAVPLVAERAGVGAGTIYRYFASKEELVNAVYQRWKSEMLRVFVRATEQDTSPREEFHHWWRGLWQFATEHPTALAFVEMHYHAAHLDEKSRAIENEVTATAVTFARRGQQAGAMKPVDPELLIALVMGAFVGLVKAAGEDGLRHDEAVLAASEACVWDMVSSVTGRA